MGCFFLLIIIGILSAAILFAINPVEQISKASDARMRAGAAELLNALERYNVDKGSYPWKGDIRGKCPKFSGVSTCSDSVNLDLLIEEEELSPDFKKNPVDGYFITSQGGGVKICFAPESTAFEDEARYSKFGEIWLTGLRYICIPEDSTLPKPSQPIP